MANEADKILKLSALIKSRLCRDLAWLSTMEEAHPEIQLVELLEMLRKIEEHYIRMDALLEFSIIVNKDVLSKGKK